MRQQKGNPSLHLSLLFALILSEQNGNPLCGVGRPCPRAVTILLSCLQKSPVPAVHWFYAMIHHPVEILAALEELFKGSKPCGEGGRGEPANSVCLSNPIKIAGSIKRHGKTVHHVNA